MSEHHADPIEENIDAHPVKLAIVVLVGAVAMVIGIMMLAQLAVGLYASRSLKDDPSMQPERVAARIAPVARVDVAAPAPSSATPAAAPAPSAPATATVVASAAPTSAAASAKPAAASASGVDGKQVFDSTCTACHAIGLVGAPKFADKAAWAPRIAQGKDALYKSALSGKNAMPPKGGNSNLSEAEVKAAVDYMVAAAK